MPRVEGPAHRGGGYLLKGLGLLAIAVLSGVIWYLLNAGGGGAEDGGGRAAGEYRFSKIKGPVADGDCAGNAYDDVAEFFVNNRCERLTRVLYTSTPASGSRVVTSVATVRMPDERLAVALKRLTDRNGTGNVDDLVRAGVSVPGAPDDLGGGGYASTRKGRLVVIVESDYLGEPAKSNPKLLVRVSQDALRLGG